MRVHRPDKEQVGWLSLLDKQTINRVTVESAQSVRLVKQWVAVFVCMHVRSMWVWVFAISASASWVSPCFYSKLH